MNIFVVLMWKNFLVRRRRYLISSIELLTPILLLMTFVFLNIPDDCTVPYRRPWTYVRASKEVSQIKYAPDTNVTKMLMDEVADALNVPEFQSLPWDNGNSTSERSIENSLILRALNNIDAVIVFENLNSDETLPDKLTYTVLLNEPSMPRESLRSSKIYQSIYGIPDRLGDSFLKLQWAIDSMFIKMKSNSTFELPNIIIRHRSRERFGTGCYLFSGFLLSMVVLFAPLLTFVLVMTRLNEERCNGIEAFLEVSGVPWFMIDITNFLDSLLPCFILSVIAAATVPLASNRLIVFLCLFLHCVSMIALALACSNITTCGPNAMSTALFIFVGIFLFDLFIWPSDSRRMILRLKGLLPQMPSIWFLWQFHIAEFVADTGVHFFNWSYVFKINRQYKRTGSVKLSTIMLLVQIVLYFMLSMFMRLIRPKQYGKALPWNFPCRKEFWVKQSEYMPPTTSNHDPAYDRYFEDASNDMDVAVEVVKVTKTYYSRFTSIVALNGVSLKVNRGEITVIVGHNGSGKTTLLSIIAGMQKQSSGKVFIDRLDTSTSKSAQKIAFCPQQSILFPILTVREHFKFFSKIADSAEEATAKTIERVMTQMDLNAMEASMPPQLSVGQQRRLQIGCLLCSKASLLLLDDPTAEIDVEARKDLYQILSTLRGERTIILTTNLLEEAEILGDRVAALQRGELRCYATPQFLKKAVDSGARVKVTSFQPMDSDLVTKTIRGAAPDATLSENVMGSLVYNIPPGSNMTAVFEILESNKAAMDIEALGVGPVSLEEAFMKLCTDGEMDTSKEREKVLKIPDQFSHTEGFRLLLIQTRELFKRQLDYTYSRLLAFIFIHIIVPPIVVMMFFLNMDHFTGPWVWEKRSIDFDMYNELHKPSAAYSLKGYDPNKTQHTVDKIEEIFPQLQLRHSDEEHENCSCLKCKKFDEKSRNIFDIYVDAHNAKLNYDQNVEHSATVGLNVLSNIIAAQQLPYNDDKAINMRIGVKDFADFVSSRTVYDELNIGLSCVFIIFILLITVIDDVGLPCIERISNARYYHIMAGCPPWLYLLVTFIYQVACNALMVISSILITTAIFNYDTLRHFPAMRAYFTCLLVCGISFYVLGYFLSQCFNEETTKVILLLIMIIGLFTFLYLWISSILRLYMLVFYTALLNTQIFNPVCIYVRTIKHFIEIALRNQFCALGHKDICKKFKNMPLWSICCVTHSLNEYGAWFSYFTDDPYLTESLKGKMAWIFVYIIVFMILVLLMEYRVFSKLWNKYEHRRKIMMPSRKYESNDVAAEKEYVKNTIIRSKDTIKELVLVSRVWKIFFKLCDDAFLLKDLNYSVRKGECFGIVGLNGAGKTSVFKAMTRQFLITKGLMFADGHFSHNDTVLYLKGLGYCPHSLYLDTFRSGHNNMRMLMCLRGIDDDDVKTQCDAWQKILGLERFRQILVDEYSYGLKRRLSVGAAMCRGERVLLLDQPLAGVDVAARRQLFLVIERALTNGCSIVHASHNLGVVDHMCNQVTILDAGEMGALGSPSEYKKSYAPGHSVVIILRANFAFTSSGSARVQVLKDFMHHEFNGILRDEYLLHLHFIITKRLRYSIIHEKLNSMTNEFKEIIEDYSAYDETFEDAFIQFVNDSRYSVKPQQTW